MDDGTKDAIAWIRAQLHHDTREVARTLLGYLDRVEADSKQVTECYEHLAAGTAYKLVADSILSRNVPLVTYFKMAGNTIRAQREEMESRSKLQVSNELQECGHHVSMRNKSVETGIPFCDYCRMKEMFRDSLTMEEHYKQKLQYLQEAHTKLLREWRDFTLAVGHEFVSRMKPGEPFGAADMSRFESCIRKVEKGLDQ